jgi:hypothetical protein
LYGSAASTRRGGGGTKQRSTASTVEGVAKDISLSVVALPTLKSEKYKNKKIILWEEQNFFTWYTVT